RSCQPVIDAAVDAGKKTFVEKAQACPDQLTEKIKESIGPVVTCVVDAAKAAFKSGATAGARQALKEAIALFANALGSAKSKLQKFIGDFKTQYPAVSGLQAAIHAGADSGKKTFLEKPQSCPDHLPWTVMMRFGPVVTCVVDAAKAAFQSGATAGAKQALKEAISLFATALGSAKSKLQKFIGDFKAQYPAVSGLQAVIDAAVDSGKKAFVEKAQACPDQLTEDIKKSSSADVTCLVDA